MLYIILFKCFFILEEREAKVKLKELPMFLINKKE